jgi:peptidyl-prolyl cis-trans isomerase SurA
MDVATKEQGGELGWVRRGTGLDQHFEDAAFSLRPGVVSEPVESPFGFHLIQVERSQPAEVQVRHILIMPDIGMAEADSARRTADRVRAALVAGAPFDSVQRAWHDKAEERDVSNVPLEILPPTYAEALKGLPAGGISPVFRLEAPLDPMRSKYTIVQLTGRSPAGEVRYEDVKEDIRTRLNETLTQERFIERLRRATYVEVRVK